eukprot:CAMPEP_0173174254 /NCGR_PEP_ID=MMETSP1141-20130122/3259_1 /TAXON_ID=483371 /ORGANISM="non described non described, Strain CCMP2298" /LENGTH=323 /DNA_ID=CAMNT_0014096375 /DNA_START=258 /DNA_END=1229 /DNA_ORIENTATION=+
MATNGNCGKFYLNTPLISLSGLVNTGACDVYLKLDNLQPSGSFKDRGISNMVTTILETDKVGKLVCSSGGNAGHAVATVGKKLGIPVDVFVPTTTKAMMVAKLRHKGANVVIHGDNWNAADKLAREAAAQPDAHYIPPYDDPRIWDGHSTIVDELAEAGVVPDKIVLSVGGGGLLCGIQRGILRHGWQDKTHILAAETVGTASFAKAHRAGKPEVLTAITSMATSLGALSVTASCLDSGVMTTPLTVEDKEAVIACRRFSDDFNMLVEPACGAALSYVYGAESSLAESTKKEVVVVIVCGGSVVNTQLLDAWCNEFDVKSLYI